MCAEAHGWWVETLGGWDIQCSCVSLSEAMGEGAVGEGQLSPPTQALAPS